MKLKKTNKNKRNKHKKINKKTENVEAGRYRSPLDNQPKDGRQRSPSYQEVRHRRGRRGRRVCGAEAKRRRKASAETTDANRHSKSNKPLASDASSSSQRGKEHVAATDKKRIRLGISTEETPRRDKKPRYGSITTS